MFKTLKNSGSKTKYFAREKLAAKICGVSIEGNDSVMYRIYSVFVLVCFNYSYPIIAMGDLFKYDMDVTAEIGVYYFGAGLGLVLATVLLRNRARLAALLERLEEPPFLPNPERGGEEEEHLLEEWLKFTNMQSFVFYSGSMGSIGMQILSTLYLRVRSSDYHDWKFSYGPLTFLNVTYSPNFEISWVYQNLCVFSMIWILCSGALILGGCLAVIGTQFRILQHNLKIMVERSHRKMLQDYGVSDRIPLRGAMEFDPSAIPWKYLQAELKEMIEYHLSIFDIAKELQEVFSFLMLATYINSLTVLCLEVYRSTALSFDDVRMLMLLIETISGAFLSLVVCYCGEQAAEQCQAVANAAYEVNFVGTDVRFQKSLIIIIRRSQDPLQIKAGKLIDTSLATFAWILRASYSIFTVLRNTNTDSHNF